MDGKGLKIGRVRRPAINKSHYVAFGRKADSDCLKNNPLSITPKSCKWLVCSNAFVMNKKGVFIPVLVLIVKLASANITDTIIALEPVVAKGIKFDNVSVGAKLIPIDTFQLSVNQMNSIAELFAQQSLVSITSYGPGGQAGIKIRGGSADHTTIVWNGLNLKPPMSGEINYSAINSGVFDQIEIQPGGSSTMYGSGAATGVVFLSNKLNMNRKGFKASLSTEAGSYGSYGLNGDVSIVGEKFGTRLFIGGQTAENNYQFKDGKKTKTQAHAAYDSYSLVQQNCMKFSPSTKLETDIWYSKLYKEVPSLKSTSGEGKTEQEDQNLNIALNVSHYKSNWYIKYRGGFIWYYNWFLGFDDDYYTAINESRTFINEVETKYSLHRAHKLYFGVNHTYDIAYSDSYTGDAQRNQLDFFGRYAVNVFGEKLKFNIEGRQAITDSKLQPFVYSAGMNLAITKGLNWKISGAKLYSLPDLNDLYWGRTAYASGDSTLEPEFGWNIETGISQSNTIGRILLSHEVTFYRNHLSQAIVWLPDTNNIWIPRNLEGTLTTGIEFAGQASMNFQNSRLSINYDYTYTDARVLDSTKANDELVQKRYVPKHKTGLKINYSLNGFSIAAYSQFVGERYIDDVSFPLDPYVLVDLFFNYRFNLRKTEFQIYTKIKNVLNADYEVMAGYAQPGRALYIGTNIKF